MSRTGEHDPETEKDAAWALGEHAKVRKLEARIVALREVLVRARDRRLGPGAAVEALTGTFCHECLRYVGSGYWHVGDAVCGIAEAALRDDDEAANKERRT